MTRIKEIAQEISEIAEKQAHKLWRLARTAEEKGVSKKLVEAIRQEAWDMFHTYKNSPDRLIDWKTAHILKFAFKAV